jgi:toxin ParE1/3/4
LKRRAIHWQEPASLDLVEIIEFVSRDRPSAARKLGREILTAAKGLSGQPRRGKPVPEFHGHGVLEYRQIYVGPYRLIYSVSNETVDILAVIDGRRSVQNLLFDRLMR